ncbi:MAG TPA: HlyD family efflux transporter periplasmic adaptor subunit [Candidatus Paceibacterota bacterium]|nr:HlyD family efflux transporter periplasmic adaptor subunit [Candidatus Paceibacterota bacterium]
MQSILAALRGAVSVVAKTLGGIWRRFRALRPIFQWIIGAILVALIIALFAFLHAESPKTSENLRAVSLRTVAELSGNATSGTMFGSVRARSEAAIFAENGGTVTAVHTSLGGRVGAGSILAELENASERAALLQAQGAYDAAIAARSGVSIEDKEASAKNAYVSAFTDLDTALEVYIDQLFGGRSTYGPAPAFSTDEDTRLSIKREVLTDDMNAWRRNLDSVDARDPESYLNEASTVLTHFTDLLTELSREVNQPDSNATDAQVSAVITARSTVDAANASITSAISTWRSGSTGATAGADATVKQALGSLRLAEANLEKTLIRAPIGGTVNFFPFRVGDYVSSLSHVATVAENSALEIVAYVSEEGRESLSVGMRVLIDGEHAGVITSIAPALDPITKQIEVHISADQGSGLVNGQSVRVDLPEALESATPSDGPLYLPLAAVKLRANDRVIFSVDPDNRLVATVVETGNVLGDRIEIKTELAQDLRIVSDARGLAEGERVRLAP